MVQSCGLRHRGGVRDVEYIVVTEAQWTDIKAVFQERGIDCMYSEEENGLHIYDNLDEIEGVLWAVQVLDWSALVIQEPEPVFSYGYTVP